MSFKDLGIDHISYSSMSKFEQCPRCWYYYYVKYPEVKGPDSPALVLGDAYHCAIERMYLGDSKGDVLSLYESKGRGDGFSSLVFKDYQALYEALEHYYSAVYPLYRSRVDVVEKQADVEIPGIEVPFRFRMDLVTRDGVLVDHKTAGRFEPSVKDNPQLNLYSYIYMLDTGRLPRAVELHIARKQPRGKRVEVVSHSPTLVEVLRVVSRLRSFAKRVEVGDFPSVCGRFCENYTWAGERDTLLIDSGGDPHLD